MRSRSAASTSGGAFSKKSPGLCPHRPETSSSAENVLDIAALLIVQWHAVDPELGWTLLTLFCASVLLWKLGGEVRRRMRFVWSLSLVAFLLWLAGGWQSSSRWIVEAN